MRCCLFGRRRHAQRRRSRRRRRSDDGTPSVEHTVERAVEQTVGNADADRNACAEDDVRAPFAESRVAVRVYDRLESARPHR
jgi:predicted HD phosphohydrolase